ncbi:MAG TPA: universal stress protein [Chthoniobacterales bacterium]|jgi:nucleotide-binding universal stress UspA family protein
MYKKILVALDNSPTDRAMFPHITELAKLHHSKLLLVHVADGWAARNYNRFELADSEEMKADRDYLDQMTTDLSAQGLEVQAQLELGDPATGILKIAEREKCDLIAMTTHGHRFLKDLIYGSTITQVRHQAKVPVLLVNAAR